MPVVNRAVRVLRIARPAPWTTGCRGYRVHPTGSSVRRVGTVGVDVSSIST